MYDLPALREATDSWWTGLAGRFRRAGLKGVPDGLTRPGEGPEFWLGGDLLFSQACGYPLITSLAGRVGLLGTPCYDMDGCDGPDYCSFVIVRKDSRAAGIADLRGRRCAVNMAGSWSGHHALRLVAAPLVENGRPAFDVVLSGGHVASIDAVASGSADFASVDCVMFGLLSRYEPERTDALRVLQRTPAMPGLPYIAGGTVPARDVEQMRAGLRSAMESPDLAEARSALGIEGIACLDACDYEMLRARLDSATTPELVR